MRFSIPLLLVLFGLTTLARADDSIFHTDVNAGVAIESRTSDDPGTPIPGRVLVAIETHIGNNKSRVDYAWITGKVGWQLKDGSAVPAGIDIDIVPVLIHEDDLFGNCHAEDKTHQSCMGLDFRVLPGEIRREVSFGMDTGVVIYGMGMQGQLASVDGKKLIRAFVDFAGIRYIEMATTPSVVALDVMRVGIQSKLSWSFWNDHLELSWYPLIAKGSMGEGRSGGPEVQTYVFTGEALTRLEAALKTAYGTYATYLEGGAEGLAIFRPGDEPNDVKGAGLARLGFEVRF